MFVKQIEVGNFAVFAYIVACKVTKEALVIDPAGDTDRLIEEAQSRDYVIKHIVNTHSHVDHIIGNRKMKERTGARIIIHELEAQSLIHQSPEMISSFGGEPSPPADVTVRDGDMINIGETSLKVLHTPGHSPGAICLYHPGMVFTGDTLFVGAVGRTDLGGGSFEVLAESIHTKLFTLPDDTVVAPGHNYGDSTKSTIGREKAHNPYVGAEVPIKKFLFLIIAATFFCSCQTVPMTEQTPQKEKPTVAVKKVPKIALVLGGGSAKGFAHVGVIRILEQEKIPIHMVVGTSVGSVIGAIYASNPDSFQLEWATFKIEKGDILDFSIINSKLGPVQGTRLETFMEQTAKAKRVEDTKIAFYPVATDLNTGETVTLEKGPLAKAVHASSAIPGIFVPVTFGKRTLVDGGVTDNVASDIARAKGADIVIAVNLQRNIKEYDITSAIDVIAQSINIMMHENNKARARHADILIEPDIKGVSIFDFSQKKVLVEAGMKAARSAMPKIKEAIAAYK